MAQPYAAGHLLLNIVVYGRGYSGLLSTCRVLQTDQRASEAGSMQGI